MTVKHTHTQCQQAVGGIKELLEQLQRLSTDDTAKHICESAIDICNNLLREPEK